MGKEKIGDFYPPEQREKDLAGLLFLRDQTSKISSKDFHASRHVLTPEQINPLMNDLDEALKDVKSGMPLSLSGKSLQELADRVNNLRQILIDYNILKKDETL